MRNNRPEAMKVKAREAANYALRTGRLTRQPCEKCGETHPFMVKHHESYSRPLDVNWLCKSCHGKYHSYFMKDTYWYIPNFYQAFILLF